MKKFSSFAFIFGVFVVMLSSCAAPAAESPQEPTAVPTTTPEWFDIELTDVQTGKVFTMNDFAGKVVLVETMAVWCPNCIMQAGHVYRMHEQLDHPEDLISVSLDVDFNETDEDLKEYTDQYGFDWRFAVAPIEVARALGNLYSAQYLNPPLSPMLIIDREGNVHELPYDLKDSDTLQAAVEPFLNQQ